MRSMDCGLKWIELALKGQYLLQWIIAVEADGPLPLDSTHDHDYAFSAKYCVITKKLWIHGRSLPVFDQYGNSWEYGGGVKWHFLPTERLWINADLFRINHAPYSGAFTPYTAGMDGWVPMIQTIIAF